MKDLLSSLAYGINSMLSIFFLCAIGVFLLWLCVTLPKWWLILMVIMFPVAHLLDKYWWRNTDMYHRVMEKLWRKSSNHRRFK